ncbi:hypothetical protein D3C80_1935820 [compost metagenome]
MFRQHIAVEAVALHQTNSAASSLIGHDGNAGSVDAVNIAVNGAYGYLKHIGEFLSLDQGAVHQQNDDGEQTVYFQGRAPSLSVNFHKSINNHSIISASERKESIAITI